MFEVKVKADLKDLDRLTRKFPEASKEARMVKLTEALMLLERAIVMKTPYGAGPIHLRDSVHSKARTVGTKVYGVVGTPLEHGLPVEHGTKPHFPPIGPIQHWVQYKLHIQDETASRAAAYAISRAISRRGTKGAHMFEESFEDHEATVIRILEEIPADIIARVSGAM